MEFHREEGDLLRPAACVCELGWEVEGGEAWGLGEEVGRGLRTGQKVRSLLTHWDRMSCFFSVS